MQRTYTIMTFTFLAICYVIVLYPDIIHSLTPFKTLSHTVRYTYKKKLLSLAIGSSYMDALWNLEARWKPSTQEAFLLLVSTAFAVIALCMATTVWIKKVQRKQEQQLSSSLQDLHQSERIIMGPKWTTSSEPSCGWGSIKRVLAGSVRWSRGSKWEESRQLGESWRETPRPLLDKMVGEVEMAAAVGWRSHNSDSPVWQRPILMGEKCELPRFSGLILYDERGHPLCNSHNQTTNNKEKTGGVTRTTLRDLL